MISDLNDILKKCNITIINLFKRNELMWTIILVAILQLLERSFLHLELLQLTSSNYGTQVY